MEINRSTYGHTSVLCQMCKNKTLQEVLDLGMQPHSDDFLEKERLGDVEFFFPLKLMTCTSCGLLQIDYFVNPEILYQTNYVYESSITKSGVQHYTDMAKSISDRFNFPPASLALDIGSNVGVLLSGFKTCGFAVLGIDPAHTIAQKAIDNGIDTVIDFFSERVADTIVETKGTAKVITGTNVFAHLHDIDSAMRGIQRLLDKDGVFVIEAPYALDLIEKLEYDTIYHQHIGYLSVKPMAEYFKRFNMELFDVEFVPIHGGSLRYFVAHRGAHVVTDAVDSYIQKEETFGLYNLVRLAEFRDAVLLQRTELLRLLNDLKLEGKKIAGISAPAKGNTLLNFCGINQSYLDFTTEKSEYKKGRYTPGTHIPILSDADLLSKDVEYALILAWNFSEEIMKNMEEYKNKGGKFIIPVPKPVIK